MENARKFLVAATFEKANTYVFAGMVIHNPKVGSSSLPPLPWNQQLRASHRFLDCQTLPDSDRIPLKLFPPSLADPLEMLGI
ncbi:MAG: hypothetical protein C5B44_00305 [Acidobacteria bacterium]|nr:MAG: hypothetical protein C5B44_00305 [Acidobacteriota bacterium]